MPQSWRSVPGRNHPHANPHDFLLHRKPKPWPHEKETLTAAVLPNGTVLRTDVASAVAESRNSTLFLVHGYAHTAAQWSLHASVLALSRAMKLMRQSDYLLYINENATARAEMLIDQLERFQSGTLRMLIHTSRDIGHLCSEFQLLALSAHVWQRYAWVIYISGPDTYLTPVATAKIESYVRTSSMAMLADNFPSSPEARRGSGVDRYALDVFMFRPSAGFLLRDRGAASAASGPRSIWTNATAVCMAHRGYHGLPETVLHWVQKTWNLERGALGKRASWGACVSRPVFHCPIGEGGVWHTHNTTLVQKWLDERPGILAAGKLMLRRVDASSPSRARPRAIHKATRGWELEQEGAG